MIAINKNNLSFEDIMRLAKASETKKTEDVMSAVESKLSSEKMSELHRVLKDKKALEDLLKSEQAQQLMRKLGK